MSSRDSCHPAENGPNHPVPGEQGGRGHPASQGAGGRYAEGHGYGLVLFGSVLQTGFNLISGIAAVASSHVFTASAHHVSGNLTSWAWVYPSSRSL